MNGDWERSTFRVTADGKDEVPQEIRLGGMPLKTDALVLVRHLKHLARGAADKVTRELQQVLADENRVPSLQLVNLGQTSADVCEVSLEEGGAVYATKEGFSVGLPHQPR